MRREAWLPEIGFVYLPCCNNEVATLNKNKGYGKFKRSIRIH